MNKCDTLLKIVHKRLGGVGISILTFGESGEVEIEWNRSYNGILSDERVTGPHKTLEAALNAILDYEDKADQRDSEMENKLK